MPASSCPGPFMEEGSEPEYNLTLSCWGPYEVTVIGNHSAGSFVSQLRITAEGRPHPLIKAGTPCDLMLFPLQLPLLMSWQRISLLC